MINERNRHDLDAMRHDQRAFFDFTREQFALLTRLLVQQRPDVQPAERL